MPVRRKAPAKATAAPRRTRPSAAPAKAAPRKAAPAKPASRTDVTVYASKPSTDYHKAYAKWIVTEVGYDPESASSKRAAFLKGVSIATAARPAFMESDYLEEWRERTGTAKRGPKGKAEEEAPVRKTRRQPEPEVVEEDDDFEDEEIDEDEEEEIDEDDDDFEDDEDADEDEDDDEEFDDEDEEELEEEEEEAPAPRRRGRPAKAAPTKRAPAKTAKRAPAKAPAKRTRGAAKDDDFLF